MKKRARWQAPLALAAGMALCAMNSSGADAADLSGRYAFSIPSQPLSAALLVFSAQANIQVMTASADLNNLVSAEISGERTAKEALDALLQNTGLKFHAVSDDAVAIEPIKSRTSKVETVGSAGSNPGIYLAQSDTASSVNDESVRRKEAERSLESAGQSSKEAIEEVIVTATKREASIKDVPSAITAFSEERLERMGADSFRDFALSVPGLQMNELGSNESKFVIRGITTQPFGGNIQDTVVTYIDDLPTVDSRSNLSTPDVSLFDVERVEVLRGPQGTLFGSGAMGGAIRVITNKPDLSGYAAKVEVGIDDTRGGDMSSVYKGMINVPLVSEKLALRAVAYYRDTGGWIDNQGRAVTGSAGGENTNAATAYGARAVLRYQPNDRLDVLAKLSYQKDTPEDSPYYTSIAGGQRIRAVAVNDFKFEESTIANLVVKYDFGPVNLQSSTTYYDRKGGAEFDGTSYSTLLLPTPVASQLHYYVPSKNYFEELQLSSNTDGRLSWLAGAFYRYQADRDYLTTITLPGSQAILGSGINGAPNNVVYNYLAVYDTDERAIFGELSYRLTDRLDATVGARIFEHSIEQNVAFSGGLFYRAGPGTQHTESDDGATNYKFSLRYKTNEAVMVYATASQGFRVGSPNVIPAGAAPGTVPAKYESDQLWNYEVGAKTGWFDNRLILNGALYYIDWTDMQVSTTNAQNFGFIGNVGKAHSRGAELEINALLGAGIEYVGAASYVDAKIDTANAALRARVGDRIPGVPKVTLSNTVRKSFNVGAKDAYLQATHQFVGNSNSEFNPGLATALEMGGYHLVGLRGGIFIKNWEVAVHADNLFDDDSFAIARNAGAPLGTQYFALRPRTIGLTLRTEF